MEALADGEYDAIVMGTGLKECVISGLLSVQGKKVLQVDRNGYYGGDGASLNLTTLFEKFQAGTPPESLGTCQICRSTVERSVDKMQTMIHPTT